VSLGRTITSSARKPPCNRSRSSKRPSTEAHADVPALVDPQIKMHRGAVLLLLTVLCLCVVKQTSGVQIIDDRMDKVVDMFENFKDVYRLNSFLYALHTVLQEVNPAYGPVKYYHNIRHTDRDLDVGEEDDK
uniref:Uncharacterized protein n=1 Tax=Anopheles albimanus TaxID=7167 RepID=A0A182FY04_ANOAL